MNVVFIYVAGVAGFAVYLFIGCVISAVLDRNTMPNGWIMLFWPIILVFLIPMLIIGGAMELGMNIGDWLADKFN